MGFQSLKSDTCSRASSARTRVAMSESRNSDQTIGATARRCSTITILQAGRALAAIAVVMMHTKLPTEHMIGAVPAGARSVLDRGFLGVDFFFVLSGFIIFYTSHNQALRTGWAKRFLESRIARIYVPYLPIGIALGLLYSIAPGISQSGQPWSWVGTLTLLPQVPPSTLGVAWTLTYEMTFYLLCLGFFRSGRPLICGVAWAALIVAYMVFGQPFKPLPDMSVASVLLNPINLEFVFGMFAAWFISHHETRRIPMLFAAGAATVALFGMSGFPREYSFVFGGGITLMLIPAVQAELRGSFKVGRVILLLGNASYAIYLVHFPVLSLMTRIVAKLIPLANWQANIAIGMATSIAAGIAYHLAYERPALNLVKPGYANRATGSRHGATKSEKSLKTRMTVEPEGRELRRSTPPGTERPSDAHK